MEKIKSNIVIIGMFTFIAIATILGITEYGYKKMLSRVLIVAVLARAARLGPAASELLDAAAVIPGRAEWWLLEKLVPAGAGSMVPVYVVEGAA